MGAFASASGMPGEPRRPSMRDAPASQPDRLGPGGGREGVGASPNRRDIPPGETDLTFPGRDALHGSGGPISRRPVCVRWRAESNLSCAYRRGHITVRDRAGLKRRSCGCYGVIKKAYERLLPATTAT